MVAVVVSNRGVKQVNGGSLMRLDVSPGLPLGGKTRGD